MNDVKPTREQLPRGDEKPEKKDAQRTPNIKKLLLSGPRFDMKLPKRKKWRRRPPVIFD
jgi:hypothetical protein